MGTAARSRKPRLTDRSVELLLELFDQPEPALSGAALQELVSAEARPLIEAGILTPFGHNTTSSTTDGRDRPVALVWREGSFGYFGKSGWAAVEPNRLAQYVVDTKALCRALLPDGRAAEPTELVPNLLWDLGTVRLPGRAPRVPVVFGRRLFDVIAWREMRTRLVTRQSQQMIIVATAQRDVPDDLPSGCIAVLLSDALKKGSLQLNLAVLAEVLDGILPSNYQEAVVVSGGGRQVRLHGEVFTFSKGDQQRRIIMEIYERYRKGELMCSWVEVAEHLQLGQGMRLRDYFKKRKPPVLGRLLREQGGMVGFCLPL